MLGRGAIIGEGITEKDAILAAAEKMEEAQPGTFYPLDLSGVTVISADGDGSIPEFGAFFRAMHIKAFSLYDARKRKPEETQKLSPAARVDLALDRRGNFLPNPRPRLQRHSPRISVGRRDLQSRERRCPARPLSEGQALREPGFVSKSAAPSPPQMQTR
jgi:hypothetical protein